MFDKGRGWKRNILCFLKNRGLGYLIILLFYQCRLKSVLKNRIFCGKPIKDNPVFYRFYIVEVDLSGFLLRSRTSHNTAMYMNYRYLMQVLLERLRRWSRFKASLFFSHPNRIIFITPNYSSNLYQDNDLCSVLEPPVHCDKGFVQIPIFRIGSSVIPSGRKNVRNAWREAEVALQMCQLRSPNVLVYNESINKAYKKRLFVLSHFELSLQNSEISVNFQPLCDKDGILLGFEALARWHSREFGMIAPDEFIPLLERYGQISKLTEFMLKQADSFLSAGSSVQSSGFFVSVNISPYELLRLDCVERIRLLLQRGVIRSRDIVLEITESRYISENQQVQQSIRELRSMGFQICLDDFGTGYSNLSLIRDLPLKHIKLDKSFLKRIPDDEYSLRILEAVINFSSAINKTLVVEGVEEKSYVDLLARMGCRVFQGYYFSKPVSFENALALINHSSARMEVTV